jgi:hypothetical protein
MNGGLDSTSSAKNNRGVWNDPEHRASLPVPTKRGCLKYELPCLAAPRLRQEMQNHFHQKAEKHDKRHEVGDGIGWR